MKVTMNIIDNTQNLETNIKKIWGRNVFFLWWYAVLFLVTLVRALFNRICQIPRLIHNAFYDDNRVYSRLVSKYKWIEEWNNIVDSNFWGIFCLFFFFFIMALSKTLYHIWKITFFLWVHIIKPIAWMFVTLLAAKTISNGMLGKK